MYMYVYEQFKFSIVSSFYFLSGISSFSHLTGLTHAREEVGMLLVSVPVPVPVPFPVPVLIP